MPARALEAAKAEVGRLADGERLAGLLRGGFWRSFLVKYPEVGDTYWKMLRLSRAIHGGARPAPGRCAARPRVRSRSGADRPTTRTGTASSAAAICRICAEP